MTNNRMGYPDWVVEVIGKTSGEYSAGKSHYTATSLLKPPYLKNLETVHKDEIVYDPADQVASVLGTAIHAQWDKCLKNNNRYIIEERFYKELDGFIIGGQIDLYDKQTKMLWDTKTTSVYKVVKSDDHFDYEAQNAINKWLLHHNGIEVERSSNAMFLMDWRSSEAKRDSSYPQSRFHELHIPLWSLEDTEKFIRERIYLHEQAKKGFAAPCSERDRWARPSAWAVTKVGRKSAVRVLDNEAEAIRMAGELGKGHGVEHRPGQNIRCESYCSVNKWCGFYTATYGQAS